MAEGTPVNRSWVLILQDGTPVIDWGDNLFQDISSGRFIHCAEKDISHTILDDELDQLRRTGRIVRYDKMTVFFTNLPERPVRTLD